jgi:GTP-binding protein
VSDPAPAASGRRRPVVAVVGRPNVGKSTLVNRIVGRREVIVEESPGVTRDRKVVQADWAGHEFSLVDTGGWQVTGDRLDQMVSAQAERAVREADVVVFVVDATVGPTEDDTRVARLLQRSGRPSLLAVNKVDNEAREVATWEFASLGFPEAFPISALHGRGSGELLDALVAAFPRDFRGASSDDVGQGAGDAGLLSVAIVGRPNVGKSTLFNRLAGDEQAIVHDTPGTTRDAIDTIVETPEGRVRFVDTAGLRRRTKEAEGAEYYSMVRALQAIDRAELALLVIDASEGVTRQDQRLAERVDAAGDPIVVLLNKWDLLDAEAKQRVRAQVADMLGFVSYAPALEVSAKTGTNLRRLYPALASAAAAYRRRVPTAALNRAIAAAQATHPAPGGARVLYAVQGATDPPTFTFFATKALPAGYLRYLERTVRESFGFGPTPIKLRVRRRAS